MKKLSLVLAIVLLLVGCSKQSIKIGFVGSLSIKQSQLSVDARNAIELYFEQVNDQGGVNGRKLELVSKDDFADNKVAHEKHDEFMDEGVNFIIGHMTSNMAQSMLESKDEKVLFITPSISSPLIDNKDDNIIRTAPNLDGQAYKYLDTMKNYGYQNNLIVYDLMNQGYTELLANRIVSYNETNQEYTKIAFDSRTDNVIEFISEIDMSAYDSVLFLSQAIDTASFAQKVRLENDEIFMMSVSWSMTEDLIKNGGSSIEGMQILGVYFPEVKSQKYLDFSEAYLNKFGYSPSFVSFLAYDAAMVLVKAIDQSDSLDIEIVKSKILEIEEYEGIFEDLSINEYGDSSRSYMNYEVKDGEFVPLD